MYSMMGFYKETAPGPVNSKGDDQKRRRTLLMVVDGLVVLLEPQAEHADHEQPEIPILQQQHQ